jgi:hypothetical protein
MGDLREFAQECDAAARGLRRVPADLRRSLGAEVQEKVARPLADRIAAAATGPHARALAAGVKARKLADPTIVVGGAKRLVSGTAQIRDLVPGNEWGGGRRTTRVPRRPGRRGYRFRSTNQFLPAHPFIYPTIGRNGEWILDEFADIVNDVLGKALNDG